MPHPFPGMDPYLEHPALWRDAHNRLIAATADVLGPLLRPRYYARLEERTYLGEPEALALIGLPDLTVRSRSGEPPRELPAGGRPSPSAVIVDLPALDEVREWWLEVHAAGTDQVVTVLELLSPTNKAPGEGRQLYEKKRRSVLGTLTSLVEIDLLRAGKPMAVRGAVLESDYRILVCPRSLRPRAELLPFSVRDPIPTFRLPLLPEDEEPEVDLGAILASVYDRASYDLSIDYRAEPVPPLPEVHRAWADELLRRAGKR